ncbi:MAG: serine hydrolase [Candidatus Saccharibacteria bacterium]
MSLFVIILVASAGFGIYHAGESVIAHAPKSTAKTSTPAKTSQSTVDAGLNQILAAWAGQHSFTSSVVVTELTGSMRTASYNPTASVVPASTYKLYVAYAILHGAEQGTYTLFGNAGDGNSIQTDLTDMIVNSDNTAARTLGFMYGWKNINALLQTQGIDNTNLYNYIPPSTNPVGDKHTTANRPGHMAAKVLRRQTPEPGRHPAVAGSDGEPKIP